MTSKPQSNWRAIPAFNAVYDNPVDCVTAAVAEFQRRQKVTFVILRSQTKPLWAMMPFTQYRHLPNDHEVQPCTVVFFGDFSMLRAIAHGFPPDLFQDLPAPGSAEADQLTDLSCPPHYAPIVPQAAPPLDSDATPEDTPADPDHADNPDKADVNEPTEGSR
jgi:hypothetical protein